MLGYVINEIQSLPLSYVEQRLKAFTLHGSSKNSDCDDRVGSCSRQCVGIAIGIGLIHAGILQPLHGFLMFAAACLLGGASAILLGLIGVVRARFGKGTIRAYVAIAVGAILVGTAVVKAMPARELPRINDITTDLNDVPAFVIDTGESGRDMSFNVEFSGPIRTAYADLKTTVLIEPTGKVFDRVYVVPAVLDGTLSCRQRRWSNSGDRLERSL